MSDWGVKAPSGKVTANFSWAEAQCRCGCGRVADIHTVELTAAWLEQARLFFGDAPIHINSWCRCPEHNRKIEGALKSQHLLGRATDITVKGLSPFQVWFKIRWACWGHRKLIKGLGKYPSFTHIDWGPVRKWSGGE